MAKNNNEVLSREDRIQKAIALYKSQPHPKSQKKAAEAFQIPRSTLSVRLRALSKEQEEEALGLRSESPQQQESSNRSTPSESLSNAPSDSSMSTQSYREFCRRLVDDLGTEVLPASAIDLFENIICEHSANIEAAMESTMDRLQDLKDHVEKAKKREKGPSGPDFGVADYLAGERYKIHRQAEESSQISDSEEEVASESSSGSSSQPSQYYLSSSQKEAKLCKKFLDTVEGAELPQMAMLTELETIVSKKQKRLVSAMDGVQYMKKSTEKATKRERDHTLPFFLRGEGGFYDDMEMNYLALVEEIETHLTPQMRKRRRLQKEEERLEYFEEKEARRAVAAWEYGQELERQEQEEMRQQKAKKAKKPSKKPKKATR